MNYLITFVVGVTIGAYPESALAIGQDIIELVQQTYEYIAGTAATAE